MKRSVGSVLVVLLLLAVVPLSRAQLRIGAGPHLGLAFTSFKEPVGDAYGTGLLFGAHGDVNLNRFITLRLSFDYASFGANEDKLKGVAGAAIVQSLEERIGQALNANQRAVVMGTVTAASGARLNVPTITVAGLGKISTGTMVTPYGIVGLGMSFVSFADLTFQSQGIVITTPQGQQEQFLPPGTSTTAIDSETKFGLEFGAGSEFRINRSVKLLFEVKYHMIFMKDGTNSYLPLVVGATFDF